LINHFFDNRKEDRRARSRKEFGGTVVKHNSPESGGVEANMAGAPLAEDADKTVCGFIGQSGICRSLFANKKNKRPIFLLLLAQIL
jgi:hypothetical protein